MPQKIWDFVNYEQPSDGTYYFPEGSLVIINGYVVLWTRREEQKWQKTQEAISKGLDEMWL